MRRMWKEERVKREMERKVVGRKKKRYEREKVGESGTRGES